MARLIRLRYLDAINSHYQETIVTSVSSPPTALSELHTGACGTVSAVREDGVVLDDETGATVVMRLIEIGFVPGERFEIIAESWPGADPIAVRIGGSCFALRRREAAVILVNVEQAA